MTWHNYLQTSYLPTPSESSRAIRRRAETTTWSPDWERPGSYFDDWRKAETIAAPSANPEWCWSSRPANHSYRARPLECWAPIDDEAFRRRLRRLLCADSKPSAKCPTWRIKCRHLAVHVSEIPLPSDWPELLLPCWSDPAGLDRERTASTSTRAKLWHPPPSIG